MNWNTDFKPTLDIGNTINISNVVQNYKTGVKIGVPSDTAAGGGLTQSSIDGDLSTSTVTVPGGWNYVDLGGVYQLDRVFVYISPGDTIDASSVQCSSYPSGATASGEITDWTDLSYETTGTVITGTSDKPWGPVYYIEASGTEESISARWIRVKSSAGSEKIHSIYARQLYDEEYSDVYLSETDDGSPIDMDASFNFRFTQGDVQKTQNSPIKTLYFVNHLDDLDSCAVSFVGTSNLYVSGNPADSTPLYSMEVSLESGTGTWFDYRSGVMSITESGQSTGVVTSGESVPLYFRWNSPSGATLGDMTADLRFWFRVS
jgi:hypothetical protein